MELAGEIFIRPRRYDYCKSAMVKRLFRVPYRHGLRFAPEEKTASPPLSPQEKCVFGGIRSQRQDRNRSLVGLQATVNYVGHGQISLRVCGFVSDGQIIQDKRGRNREDCNTTA